MRLSLVVFRYHDLEAMNMDGQSAISHTVRSKEVYIYLALHSWYGNNHVTHQ